MAGAHSGIVALAKGETLEFIGREIGLGRHLIAERFREEIARGTAARHDAVSSSIFLKSVGGPEQDWKQASERSQEFLARTQMGWHETVTVQNPKGEAFRLQLLPGEKWRGTSRRPIPDNWRSIGQRTPPYHLAGNRNAAHPVNAILNYAYAALESETRIKAISGGYDPTIGIMHEGNHGSSKFIFDLMEPERPKVDRAVVDFVKATVFDPADFVIRVDGVCRLNPEMARMVVARVSM